MLVAKYVIDFGFFFLISHSLFIPLLSSASRAPLKPFLAGYWGPVSCKFLSLPYLTPV